MRPALSGDFAQVRLTITYRLFMKTYLSRLQWYRSHCVYQNPHTCFFLVGVYRVEVMLHVFLRHCEIEVIGCLHI